MAYGGESWAKKLARHSVWEQVFEIAKAKSKFLVLAGPEAADVRALRARGIPPERITGVDLDQASIDSSRLVEPRANWLIGDLFETCKKQRRGFDVLLLDFCFQLNEKNVDYFAKCAAFAARDGAIVVGAFSYGREQKATLADIKAASGEVKGFSGSLFAGAETPNAGLSRAASFQNWSARAFQLRGCSFDIVAGVSYVSFRASGGGTPMLYVVGRISRSKKSTKSNIRVTRVDSAHEKAHSLVREKAVAQARESSTETAADLFNVESGTLRAWRAVATRERRDISDPSIGVETIGLVSGARPDDSAAKLFERSLGDASPNSKGLAGRFERIKRKAERRLFLHDLAISLFKRRLEAFKKHSQKQEERRSQERLELVSILNSRGGSAEKRRALDDAEIFRWQQEEQAHKEWAIEKQKWDSALAECEKELRLLGFEWPAEAAYRKPNARIQTANP